MNAVTRIVLSALLLTLLGATSSGAGLWPFSAPEPQPVAADVDLDYLHVNQIAMAETDRSIRIYPPFLQDGMIYVRGRARVGGEGVGAVYFSTDGKKSWQNAAFLSNDTISFGFRPEPGRSYDLFVKVVDKRQYINDIDKTHRVITVSDENIHSVIETALAAMITAYENKDPVRFIRNVSGKFEGDTILLNSAVRNDFMFLDAIDLQGIITRISAGEKGRVHVDLAFTRFVVSARTGEPLQDSGMTELVFETTGDIPRVISMKNPLLFGVSKAASVAAGTVYTPENSRTLVVTENGDAAVKPFTEAMEIFNGGNPENGYRTTAAIMPQLPFD